MKKKLVSIFTNGLPWGMAFFALAFLIGYTGNIGLHATLKISALVAIAALLANGLLHGRFSKSLKKLEAISLILDDAELLLAQAPANHLIDGNLVPGKLFLTDKKLVFKPFKVVENGQPVYEWDSTTLAPHRFYKSIWNTGGEFLLHTGEEIPLMFEVTSIKIWKEAFKGG